MPDRRRMTLTTELKEYAAELGFDAVGIASVEPSRHMVLYRSWIDDDGHGEMSYLSREDAVDRRAHLERTLPAVRSAVVVAHDYYQKDPPGVPGDPALAVIARYARGRDYHNVIKKRLAKLHRWIQARSEDPVLGRVYVDTGPILERELAERAGLGWFGKNTMLIHPRRGSYFFLGVLLLDLKLEADDPFAADHCGTCRSCLDACPTGALLGRDPRGAPRMDARRCISYLTIEYRGAIASELRSLMGNRVYGCDICQEACPWNEAFAQVSGGPEYRAQEGVDGPELVDLAERLLAVDDSAFREMFRGSPIKRAGRSGLLRNVCVALGNWGSEDAVGVLSRALQDADPLVRGHAAWALGQIGSWSATPQLGARLEREKDEWVIGEISAALGVV